jgi:hypothetical protein
MPDPRPTRTPPVEAALTRRQGLLGVLALGGLGGLALAACSSPATPDQTVAPSASAAPVSPAVADEQALIARYDATIVAFPALAAALTTIRDQHGEHLVALGVADSAPAATASDAPLSLPTDPRAAIGVLIDAERSAMRQRIDACVAATDPETARTLTFIAASEGSHVPALKDLQP